MKKFLKIAGIVLGIIVLLCILVMIGVVTFVDPNRFKPLLVEQVKKYTGRELIIDGNLSWTIFPTLGVKVGHLELSNSSEFSQKTFAEVQTATVSVRVLPLFVASVQSSGISLDGLKLYLIKNASGKANWQMLPQTSADETANESAATTKGSVRSSLGIAISGVDISNATISWIDEKAKQNYDISKFEFHAKNISVTKPFPLQISFNFAGQNPAVSGNVSLTSNISLSLDKQMYSLNNLDLDAKVDKDKKHFNINIKGAAAIDLVKQKFQLDNFSAEIANLKLSGKVNTTDLFNNPKTAGQLQVLPFDVKKWLQATGQDVDDLQSLKNLGGDFDFTAGTTLPSVDMEGKVKIDEMQASKVRVTNINVQTKMQKGVLTLAPMKADFYQGNLDGQATVDLISAAPKISLKTNLVNMQAEPLLADLASNSKLKFSGTGNVDLQVTTSGIGSDDLIKNLNGTAKLGFTNGILKGIDISYLMNSAYSLVSKQEGPNNNTEQTEFGSLTATADIKNGVVNNNDLNVDSKLFVTKGNGSIDLVNKRIDYHLQVSPKKASEQADSIRNIPIPILVKGDLDSPAIRLDSDVLMKEFAKQQLQKVDPGVKKKFRSKLKVKFLGKRGSC